MNKLTTSGTVSFQQECNNRWQTIYTSSLYGTTFSILGKFEFDKKLKKLLSCTLRLINYKGLINIAIESAKYQFTRKWVEVNEVNEVYPFPTEKKVIRVISILVHVRGLVDNIDLPLEGEYVLTDCDLKNDMYLEIDRFVKPLNNGGGHEEKKVFDSEFYYRDGKRDPHPFGKDHIEYMQAKNLNLPVNAKCVEEEVEGIRVYRIEEIEEKKEKKKTKKKSPGAVCPKGYSKIIF